MGMAASQARFLGLTARKTNVEYEGQQVNQQRTTLSNQSANYYNQLLGMTVPTPPSTQDFTKTVYSFNDGALNSSISSLIAQAGGQYLVSYTTSWQDDYAAVAAGSSIITKKADNSYFVGAMPIRALGDISSAADDPYLKTLDADQRNKVKAEEDEYKKLLDAKYGATDWMVRYVQDTTTGVWAPNFYKKNDLDKAIYDDNGSSQSYVPCFKIGSEKKTEEIKNIPARLEKDASGRYVNITLYPGTEQEVTYKLETSSTTDQAAYSDAMNQYAYNKNLYDQSIQEVNAKIEVVQGQDKNLELRLKQLDTEQSAISTEMDAVKKVIEKNTESTFKTFG